MLHSLSRYKFTVCLCLFVIMQVFVWARLSYGAHSNDDSILIESKLALLNSGMHASELSLEELEQMHKQLREKRLDYGLKAASLFLDKAYYLNDSINMAKGYHYKAVAFSRAGDYDAALKNHLNALNLREALGDNKEMAGIYNNIGILYEKLNQFEKSLEFYEKSLSIYEELENDKVIALVLTNMGGLYGSMGLINEGHAVLEKAREKIEYWEGHPVLASNLQNVAILYFREQDYENAKKYHRKAMQLYENENDLYGYTYSNYHLGKTYYKTGDYIQANAFFKEGIEIAKESGQAHLRIKLLEQKALCYASMEVYNQAFEYQLAFSNLRDSLLGEEAMDKVAFYQALYESEKKESQISQLKKERELKELLLEQQTLELSQSKLTNTVLLFLLVIVLLGGFIIVNHYRNKRRDQLLRQSVESQKAQVQAIIKTQENERMRFAKDLHDGLGQLLTALKINCTNIIQAPDKPNSSAIENASTIIKDMDQEIRNISFNIMPQILVRKGICPAISELAARINSSRNLRIDVTEYGFTHRFEASVEIAVYRIIQELVNNIIKYSGAHNVNIYFTQHEGELNVHVEDDGMGFDTALLKQSKGSGWKNICSRLKYVDGNISIDSRPYRKNSTVIIDIPLKKNKYEHQPVSC